MSIVFTLDVLASVVVLFTCIWAVLSNKINDGILIKAGMSVVAFEALANIIKVLELHTVPPMFFYDIGIALVCLGIFLRVEVYPHIAKRMPELMVLVIPFCSPHGHCEIPNPRRRSSDIIPSITTKEGT